MKFVVTVIGKDSVGIIARFSGACHDENVNILDITQRVLREDIFAMIMLCDVTNADTAAFTGRMEKLGRELMLQVHVVNEEVFNAMHRI